MSGLFFKSQEILSELNCLQTLSEPFCDSNTFFVMKDLYRNLESVIQFGGSTELMIPANTPLKTRTSFGEFDRNSSKKVHGEITGNWCVCCEKVKKSRRSPLVHFDGIASTKISICDSSTGDTLAMWSVDLGDDDAPGCFFHMHAGSVDQHFPVPRQPSLFTTPMTAIGFVLGELFQTHWNKHLSTTGYSQGQWRSIQKKRFLTLLDWKTKQIKDSTSCPWMSLKHAVPKSDLFLTP